MSTTINAVKISQAIPMIEAFLKAQLVPIVIGSPGVGKSQIVHEVAAKFKLKVIDFRLAQCDPTDLAGFPTITGDKADYLPMKHFPIEGDKIPEGYEGWLIFLDEATSAPPSIQAAAYKLILDRMVGSHRLHKNVAIVAAGNKETDNAVVQPMSTALQSRLVHMELITDPGEWTDWAASKGIDHRISAFIRFKPGNLYTFKPDHTDHTYACPRTWEFADRILKQNDITSPITLPMLAGTLSTGVAMEFKTFCTIYQDLPRLTDILNDPKGVRVPSEPSILYALTGSLANHATENNLEDMMKYIERLPVEFQVVCLRELIRRKKEAMGHAAVQKWIASSAAQLF